MADYKKFRMIGPVAVYHHKDTGTLATKENGKFREWDDVKKIEEWVKENYPDEYIKVIVVTRSYNDNYGVFPGEVLYDRKGRQWISTATGKAMKYSDQLLLRDDSVMESLNALMIRQIELEEQKHQLLREFGEAVRKAKHAEPPKE